MEASFHWSKIPAERCKTPPTVCGPGETAKFQEQVGGGNHETAALFRVNDKKV